MVNQQIKIKSSMVCVSASIFSEKYFILMINLIYILSIYLFKFND
jgi:hypothetical protein